VHNYKYLPAVVLTCSSTYMHYFHALLTCTTFMQYLPAPVLSRSSTYMH